MIDEVLSKLNKVRKVGSNYIALCPAHNDTDPSLSIAEGTDGAVLLYCHAGCSYHDIVEAIGIEIPTVQSTPYEWLDHEGKQHPIIAQYDYRDRHDILLYTVCRTADKQFPIYNHQTKSWSLGKSPRVLYLLPRVIHAAEQHETIYIVEGEKDVESLIELGLIATCCLGGAGKWRPEYNEYFTDTDVVIIADNDEPGRAHARRISIELQDVANSIIGFIPKEGKDISDHLLLGYSIEDLVWLDISEETVNLLYAKKAEEALLGAILTNNDVAVDVADTLTGDNFYNKTHGRLYNRITDMLANGKTVDPVTLGGSTAEFPYLNHLIQSCPAVSNAPDYAQEIINASTRRNLTNTGEVIIREAQSAIDVEDVFNIADKMLAKALNVAPHSQPEPIFDLLNGAFDRITSSSKGVSRSGIKTQLPSLNELIGGLEPGAFVILAASPSKGKTALMLNMLEHVCQEHTAILFSLEMTKEEIVDRMMCTKAEVDLTRYRSGVIAEDEVSMLCDALDPLSKLNLIIDDVSVTLPQIQRRVRRIAATRNVDIIAIDYLQLLSTDEKNKDSVQELTAITRALKLLAKEQHATVVCLSQLSRPAKDDKERKPDLSRLRGSGSIEQDADIVVFIYDVEKDGPGVKRLIVAKDRNGPTGEIKVMWVPQWTKFEDF